MARNRKHNSAAVRLGPLLKAVVLCLLIGGSGVGYVWQKDQIARLGQQITEREVRLKRAQTQNEKLWKTLVTMRRPQFLEDRIKELNLGLVRPQPAQVLRLTEPSRENLRPGAPSQGQFATQAEGASVAMSR